ncbi:hypothetical protein ANCCAN_15140 [Ancylostoma caninum]|uniref:SET domain-containing protein n=1 Tax=Ancylostoma caninum TaxID=29170 RepID=A0A368G390_ANCCA|nr:hypothetical protein ANCCAN_15140 [Ancylostoma caninum]
METDFFPPFSKHNYFPQLCDGVSLEYEPKRGRYIVANRDIPCGEVVCFDVGKVVSLDEHLCCYCLKALPTDHSNSYCDGCVEQERMYGPFERPFSDKLKDLGMFRLAVHLVLSYPSEEILSCLKTGEFRREMFDIIAMRSDSLAAALSLQEDEYPVELSGTDSLVKDVVSRLDKHPSWKMVPRARRLAAFRTLLKLISSRLMSNAHSIYFVDCLERRAEETHNVPTPIPSGVGLFPAASWFNHSCRSNLNSFFHENKLIFVSNGIRKGEEVCDNYGVSFFKHTRQERTEFLAGRGFTCDCSVCLTNDSIDDMLEPIIEHPDVCYTIEKYFKNYYIVALQLILKSLPNVKDYRQYRNALPDGHKIIETIAEMYVGSVGGNGENLGIFDVMIFPTKFKTSDPKERLFLYGEVLECQRRRGLHFSPEQIRILLNCVVADYDAACKSLRKRQKYMENMQVHLFAALVRMRAFYGKLYPAYDAANFVADELIQMQEAGSRKNLVTAVEKLRTVLESLKPALPTLE